MWLPNWNWKKWVQNLKVPVVIISLFLSIAKGSEGSAVFSDRDLQKELRQIQNRPNYLHDRDFKWKTPSPYTVRRSLSPDFEARGKKKGGTGYSQQYHHQVLPSSENEPYLWEKFQVFWEEVKATLKGERETPFVHISFKEKDPLDEYAVKDEGEKKEDEPEFSQTYYDNGGGGQGGGSSEEFSDDIGQDDEDEEDEEEERDDDDKNKKKRGKNKYDKNIKNKLPEGPLIYRPNITTYYPLYPQDIYIPEKQKGETKYILRHKKKKSKGASSISNLPAFPAETHHIPSFKRDY